MSFFCCLILAVLSLSISVSAEAANAPMSGTQLALYQGNDRESVLIAGARREAQLTLYDSHTWFKTYVKEFERKYPFITVSEWRNDSKNLIRRAMEEFGAGRALVDVLETTSEGMGLMKRDGLFRSFLPRQS
jgi:hypothetical protein